MKQMSSIAQPSALQIHEWIDFALDRNKVNYLSNMIRVRFNKRFIRKFADAGYIAVPPRGIIRLSPKIWERASDTERRETIIHEACHIVAFHLHGTAIKPHGVEWRQAMENCEVEPVRCHNIPLIGINHFHVGECPKAEADRCSISRRKLGDMRRNGTLLHCLTCGLQVGIENIET
ncbi:SprT family zinc-dependent metalloprotease [Rhodopirellula sallentina]|uniref:SprT protein n=1 Tax=Rhodopirellula sallentina SM41 TaxID=1263870 RepID=M5TXX1_9BACT|nr:SprT-like domain-containing protein [Rhodopirellula sallentina]EMI53869.1 sprT protein [Rhodopirellula sallentina SM41]